MSFLKLSLVLVFFASLASATVPLPPRPTPPPIPPRVSAFSTGDNGNTTIPPITTTYFFNQLIDHNNPSLGTFQQRYWHTWEFYKPGGPIVLFTPGEINAQGYVGYLTNDTINGVIAQQQNGATIVLEHRFYGLSNPYPDLSVTSFKVHNIQQAVDDLEYFANNVKLPMPGGDKVAPGKAPWILVGGSYSGALTSWTMVNKPGLFHAGYASSAVVEAITDFWAYFKPIRQHMPVNCSADVEAAIISIDQALTSGNTDEINKIKDAFGFQDMSHLDDVVGALRWNLWDWQSLQSFVGAGSLFFEFCDALEVKDGQNAPQSGWGADHAIQAWGAFWQSGYYAGLCGTLDAETCLGTYDGNSSYYTSTDIDNANRSWLWIVCNEVGWYQERAPLGHPSLVSRILQPLYDERQCQLMFPQAFPKPPVPTIQKTNKVYDGWNVHVDRLFFANGIRDPWRDATVSADGTHFPSTPSQPIAVSNGFHCSDLIVLAGEDDPTVLAVQTRALVSIKTWLADFKPKF